MLLTEYDEAKQMELFKEEGRQEGQNMFAALTTKLFSLGRSSDVEKAAVDPVYRKKLFEEFQLSWVK